MFCYVYRLTCTHPLYEKGPKYYYGARSSVISPAQDLGYWSSSRLVQQTRKNIGSEWFQKKIVGCYPTRKEALAKEIKLHSFLNVKDHELFFNQSNQTSTRFVTSKTLGNKQKEKLRLKLKATGKCHSDSSKKKCRDNVEANHENLYLKNIKKKFVKVFKDLDILKSLEKNICDPTTK